MLLRVSSVHLSSYIKILCAFLSIFYSVALAQIAQRGSQPDALILAIEVDKYKVSDSLSAYQLDGQLFLPLCQFANELSILLSCDLSKQYASGFILKPERVFELSVKQKAALLNKKELPFDSRLVRLEQDDFYIAATLIEKWFPIKISLDLSRLTINVEPLEPLPLQLRIERERAAEALKANQAKEASATHDYPRYEVPYRLISEPFIDQTLAWNMGGGESATGGQSSTTTYMTGDLLGMQASMFYNKSQQLGSSEDFRLTLERDDPDGRLLGVLRSRYVGLGSIIVPGISNITNSSYIGRGVNISNFPLSHPTQFDKHTFRGELLPGWDVELYFNDALVGYQQSSPSGQYTFLDQQLIFGVNHFRLVFHGPEGQIRVERHNFILNQSLAKPGELLYTVALQQDKGQSATGLAQFEMGISKTFSLTGAVIHLPASTIPNQDQSIFYSNLGLRTSLDNFMLTIQSAHADKKGTLNNFTLNTEILSIALSLSQARLTNGFVSELFPPTPNPIRVSTQLRLDHVVSLTKNITLPVTAQLQQDRLQSGEKNNMFTGTVTGFVRDTTLTNQITANQSFGQKTIQNSLQLSRNLINGTIRGQINYGLLPQHGLTTATLAMDYPWKKGYLFGVNLTQTFISPQQRNYGIALSKNIGAYSLRLAYGYNHPGNNTIGVQLFTSIGKDKRAERWLFDSLPRAGTGMASIRVFVDKNLNGKMDDGEEPVKGVAFILNDSTLSLKTDENGLVFLDRLPVQTAIDLAVNVASLSDPQWYPKTPGVNFVARPGRVVTLDFPLLVTSDVEGKVYLQDGGKRRAVGDVELEIVDMKQQVVASSQSASDGYYLFSNVPPGQYVIRVSPEQLRQLNLQSLDLRPLTVLGSAGNTLKVPEIVLLPSQQK